MSPPPRVPRCHQPCLDSFPLSAVVVLWKVPRCTPPQKSPLTCCCLSHLQVIEFDDGSGSVLRIQPLRTPRDEAIYECVASNSVGETSATTRLTVLRGRSSSYDNSWKNFPRFSAFCAASRYIRRSRGIR